MEFVEGEGKRRPSAQRGQASVLGMVLVFAMVFAGALAVVALGTVAIGDAKENLAEQRAEKALTQLDSDVALVALGQTDVHRMSMSESSGDYSINESAGWMEVKIENTTTGTVTHLFPASDYPNNRLTLGKIVYENGQTRIAYQGGGVWKRRGDNGSTMVSPPEFHYRNSTLTLPLITVEGGDSLSGGATIKQTHTTTKLFPNATNGWPKNPLTNHRVTLTVHSKYYKAWGQFFETRTDGSVSYNHDKNRVTIELVTPIKQRRITTASSSLSASGSFIVSGASAVSCNTDEIYTNSYNSSGTSDDYCAQTPGEKGDIVYGKDIDISGGAGGDDFRGNLTSGGSVKVGNGGGKPDVHGHINYTDACVPSPSECDDRIVGSFSTNQISGIETQPAINGRVLSRVDELSDPSNNDNGATGNITGNTLDYGAESPSDTVELTAGSYYLDRLDVPGDNDVVLDTTSGDITIAVQEDVSLSDRGTIEIRGDGLVKVYVQGQGIGAGTHLSMAKRSEIINDGYDAPQFRMYGLDNFTAVIGSGAGGNLARYVGVIYAPPGNSGTGSVTLDGGEIFGGILTGTTEIKKGSIHYDEALQNEDIVSPGTNVVKVTFLHVSQNRVDVSDR